MTIPSNLNIIPFPSNQVEQFKQKFKQIDLCAIETKKLTWLFELIHKFINKIY